MQADAFHIAPVRSEAEIEAIRRLFRSYARSLPIDLAYQGFEAELAGLPGAYAPPAGEMLLARDAAGEPVGCVAMRSLGNGICEMKRLYVAPPGRGMGLGRALAQAFMATGVRAGYREARLDTLPSMTAAIALYRRLGFKAMDAYYSSPIEEQIFMRCPLA